MRWCPFLLVVACQEPAALPGEPSAAPIAAWPAWPADTAALDALLAARSQRPAPPAPPLEAKALRAAIVRANAGGALVVGMPAIAAFLGGAAAESARRGKRSYLLFGSYHDAGAQVRAFRELVAALSPPPLAAVEQLQADGRWQGAPVDQRGDDAPLQAFLAGDRGALDTLRATQARRNYTAWKFGYLGEVVDVVLAARALGQELRGCDMPSALQAAARALGEEADVLRDLHCALSLGDRLAGREPSVAAALFFGDTHLAPARLPRFLPADAEIVAVHLLGGRGPGVGIEQELGVQVIDELLVPLGGGAYALLLPSAPLAAAIERVRVPATPGTPRIACSAEKGTLAVGAERRALSPEPIVVPLPEAGASFVLELGERLVVGAASGATTIDVESDGILRITTQAPAM